MPKFDVTITEIVTYKIEVEADSEEQAEADAEETLLQAEDTSKFQSAVEERSCEAERIDIDSSPSFS